MSTAKSVFIVDDDPAVCRAFSRLLRSHGYQVLTFMSASDFLKVVPNNIPDCLLLDVHMPGMDGLTLQAHLVGAGYEFPIVIVTAGGTPEMRETALQQGATAYVEKPEGGQVLVDAVAKATQS